MKFSILKQIITPDQPVFLAGFGNRNRQSEGVLDELYAKVALLQGDICLCLITLDVLGGDRSFVHGLKSALEEQTGLKPEQVLINFSHTHSSVYVTGHNPHERRGNYSIAQHVWPERDREVDYTEDVRYYRRIEETVIRMVQRGMEQLQDGTVVLSRGISNAGVSRRFMTGEGIKFRPNFAAEIDKDVFVFQLVGIDGGVKGIVFSYACHPTCLGKYLISSEFVGRACHRLEEMYMNATAMFLQGCAADVKPAITCGEETFKACTIEEMQQAGDSLAEDVRRALDGAREAGLNDSFHARLLDVKLHKDRLEYDEVEAIANNETYSKYKRRAARRVLESIREGIEKTSLGQYIQIWNLGLTTKLIALEGEVPAEYALKLKKLFPGQEVIVLGYSNGVSTYIPTRTILQEGGYEADSYILHGFRGRLAWETESTIIGAVSGAELLN